MPENKNFPEIEKDILKFWDDNKTFEKSVEQRDAKDSYVFYDGPPFATGLPHYGHLVAGTMKDIVPRFWTMRGKRVERRWGWDCHGLPIENIVEKEMNLNSRKDIEALGVNKFNETCRGKVLIYADEWEKVVRRMGRWVDMENDYKTMDMDFMESVWWAFKCLWDKKLVYEGYKSMHICPRCETTLSNMEVSQGYKDIKDLSVTAKFELAEEPGTFILAWTTTPWTLPGNVALAVGKQLTYAKVKMADQFFIVLYDLIEKYFAGKDYEMVEKFKGKELVGKKYKPLFDYFVNSKLENQENIYTIVAADFVSTNEGTGVVHVAPAFGEDDMMIGKEKKLPFIQHVGQNGRFIDAVTDWPGEEVKPKETPMRTDAMIVKKLETEGKVFQTEKYAHSYPHCWRCESPLLNYSTNSWFVNVTEIKDRMLKLAKKINWVPEHLKEGRFGQWLEGARDWSISRSRYWGNPIPVWQCACGEVKVIGSKEELEKLSGQKVNDLHKHFVDKIELPCEKCGSKMKRIPEVLDCWFESGSMPYGQMHYPFENKEKFENNFPAEYIAEGVDQCRTWFYTLHVLSTALFDKQAYKNVVANGIVLAEDGQKMSKSKNNYPDPMVVVEKYGADALRYYLASTSVMRAEDLCFSEKGVDEIYKKVVLILLNVLSFYKMYAENVGSQDFVARLENEQNQNVLDRWILARLAQATKEVEEKMEAYEMMKAIKPIGDFINDLSTWYVRRSRDRFKSEVTAEKEAALSTLKKALEGLSLVMAPFTPFLAEHIWQELGKTGSVHLQLWPEIDKKQIDEKLLSEMVLARQIVELGLASRDEAKVKVRQPLLELRYEGKQLSREIEAVVADELNVKKVVPCGKIQEKNSRIIKEGQGLKVDLSLEMTEELKLEGVLRELTRQINSLRKKQGFTISDRVKLTYATTGKNLLAVMASESLRQILIQATLLSDIEKGEGGESIKVNEEEIKVKLTPRLVVTT